jgi:hypothetical protein
MPSRAKSESHTVSAAMVEFLDWVGRRPRTYEETMTAWRTSCPRLSVWEDALVDGAVEVIGTARDASVRLTARGTAMLLAATPQSTRRDDA